MPKLFWDKSHSSQPEMHYVAQACLNYMDAEIRGAWLHILASQAF